EKEIARSDAAAGVASRARDVAQRRSDLQAAEGAVEQRKPRAVVVGMVVARVEGPVDCAGQGMIGNRARVLDGDRPILLQIAQLLAGCLRGDQEQHSERACASFEKQRRGGGERVSGRKEISPSPPLPLARSWLTAHQSPPPAGRSGEPDPSPSRSARRARWES